MLITDSQVHLWDVDSPERPWPKGRFAPHLPNGFSATQMIAEMDAAGVDRAVIVPPTYVGEVNDTAFEACEEYPGRFAIMGRFDAQAADARQQLEGWLSQPNMLGIRITTFVPPFKEWVEEGKSPDWFWSDCERLGIPVMLLVDGAAIALPVVQAHPHLRLVMDHMSCNLRATGAACFERIDELLALAAFPNVYVKMSSCPCFSEEEYPFSDIDPFLKRIYDAFGARRIFWGADISRLRGTYPDCVRHIKEGLPFLSEEDREWILGKSLAEALNWPEAGFSKG